MIGQFDASYRVAREELPRRLPELHLSMTEPRVEPTDKCGPCFPTKATILLAEPQKPSYAVKSARTIGFALTKRHPWLCSRNL